MKYRITLKPGGKYTAWVIQPIGYANVMHELGSAWFESGAKAFIDKHREQTARKDVKDIVVWEGE